MQTSTIASYSDQLPASTKHLWEDPCITVERDLEVSAQGGPPPSDAPGLGPNRGFLGPLSTSGAKGTCGG